MPRGSVLSHAPRFATVPVLVQLKKIWTVSVAALNYRLHELKVTTDWQYRTLCVQIAQLGYRKNEPEEAARETSQVLAKVFSALHEEGLARNRVARELQILTSELDQLLMGLVLTGIAGGRGPEVAQNKQKRAALRLVE
jgi:hypothetical protein